MTKLFREPVNGFLSLISWAVVRTGPLFTSGRCGCLSRRRFSIYVIKNVVLKLQSRILILNYSLQVDFHILKTNHFKISGNSARALDHARIALPIARECQFTKEVSWLNEHISKLQIFPEDPANDSEGLVKTISEIQTTTDGNLESNAAELTDLGIFSSDESEWETFDSQVTLSHT